MKTMKFKLLLSLLLLAISSQLAAKAIQEHSFQDFSRTIDKSFPLSADGKLELANKYGRIDISNWDRNEVAIKVRIVVKARSEKEAASVFDRINIAFAHPANLVRVETEISNSGASSWWSWGGSSNSNEFKIYYEVKMPRGARLHTQARYCDVTSDALSGESQFDVKYGKLNLDQTKARTTIDMAYGDINFQEALGAAEITLSYGKLNMGNAQQLLLYARYSEASIRETKNNAKLDARYSDIHISQANHVEFKAGYGELRLDAAKSLSGESNYTDYEIGSIRDYVDINTDYGDVELGPLASSFTKVAIQSTYSSIAIQLDKAAGYTLDAQARYAGISYPETLDISLKEKASSSLHIKGSHSGVGRGQITLRSSYGNLEVGY